MKIIINNNKININKIINIKKINIKKIKLMNKKFSLRKMKVIMDKCLNFWIIDCYKLFLFSYLFKKNQFF